VKEHEMEQTIYTASQAARVVEAKIERKVYPERVRKWAEQNEIPFYNWSNWRRFAIPHDRLPELIEHIRTTSEADDEKNKCYEPDEENIRAMCEQFRKERPRSPQGYPESEQQVETHRIELLGSAAKMMHTEWDFT